MPFPDADVVRNEKKGELLVEALIEVGLNIPTIEFSASNSPLVRKVGDAE